MREYSLLFIDILLFGVLFVTINIYFRLAVKLQIVDIPNHRSSHTKLTIRGGGIIFPVSLILFQILYHFPKPYFLLGLLLLSVISFWDDIVSISTRIRFISQVVAAFLLLYSIDINSIWLAIAILPLLIGFINGYNFMDGINGITALYSITTLGVLYYVNSYVQTFESSNFFIFSLIPLGVFLFYNFRKKAKCFAGDIGSISIAFTIAYLLISLIIITQNPIYLLFVLVYGIDILSTITERIRLKQNILKPHRMHLYQLLANEGKWSHLKVSALYAFLQLIINCIIIYVVQFPKIAQITIAIGLVILLVLAYSYMKFHYKYKLSNQ